jgi:hypothetical protein
MNTQQAYINGFVKRAAECGLSDNEAIALCKQAGKVNPAAYALLNALPTVGMYAGRQMTGNPYGAFGGLFAGGIPRGIYTTNVDEENPHVKESLSEVALPYRLGGLLLGGGAGAILGSKSNNIYDGIVLGSGMGQMLGAGIGASKYNELV